MNFRILVVCTGNLCRSPFAEHLLRRRLGEAGLLDIAVASAGIGAMPGAPCPGNVLEAAREWELDLSGHRARQISAEDVEMADLILTMERYHYHAVRAAFAVPGDKLHPLAQFDDGEGPEDVEDPMGLPLDETREIFARIALCVDSVARYYAEE